MMNRYQRNSNETSSIQAPPHTMFVVFSTLWQNAWRLQHAHHNIHQYTYIALSLPSFYIQPHGRTETPTLWLLYWDDSAQSGECLLLLVLLLMLTCFVRVVVVVVSLWLFQPNVHSIFYFFSHFFYFLSYVLYVVQVRMFQEFFFNVYIQCNFNKFHKFLKMFLWVKGGNEGLDISYRHDFVLLTKKYGTSLEQMQNTSQ